MQAIRLCAFLLCATAWAWGHDSEPINTEFASPFALQSGNIQFGFQHFRDLESFNVVAIELEYGFAPRMQFSLIFPLTRLDDGENMHVRPGNIELGFRYLLAGGSNRRFAVSANAEAGLPTGDKQVSERAYELGGAIHIDTHPAARVWTHTNLGYETPVARFEEKEKSFFYRFAVMYEATEELRPVLELVGVHDFDPRRRKPPSCRN